MKLYLKIALALVVVIVCISCNGKVKEKEQANKVPSQDTGNIIITTEVMDFQMEDTISSGWHTFEYHNNSEDVHFFLVDKYPAGKGINEARNEVNPVFQSGMDFIIEGKVDSAMTEFGRLPEWFSEVQYVGGSGLISPGETSIVSFPLSPGTYLLECYVKMPNGVFHSNAGMLKEFYVSNDESKMKEPTNSDIDITISSEAGIVFSDSINAGENLISVKYKDQIKHENFVGHDVNLVRLNEAANLDSLEAWMNWATPDGLSSPAPSGVEFLGGVNDMPEGSIGYFKADLQPGKYAFISEVPYSGEKNMFTVFNVE